MEKLVKKSGFALKIVGSKVLNKNLDRKSTEFYHGFYTDFPHYP